MDVQQLEVSYAQRSKTRPGETSSLHPEFSKTLQLFIREWIRVIAGAVARKVITK
jgi:hypothetical protein